MSALEDAREVAAYRHCRRLNAQHGKTFFLATALLPADKRPHVHALYGFARYADDLVDQPSPGSNPHQLLDSLRGEVADGLAGRPPRHPVVRALLATIRRCDIDPALVEAFLTSMHTDLSVTRYEDFDALRAYMWGSASVIGLQLLPILGVVGDPEVAASSAADLGIAFQLTNFIRDIGEDYRRGRVYLPMDSLAAHGVTPSMLARPVVGPEVRELLRAEIERARMFYRSAEPGIHTLAPSSRDCVRTALRLYSDILVEIERLDYQVLSERAAVSLRRRLTVGGLGYLRAVRARSRKTT